jgi:F-type H+-transporting ATPase subunit b
MMLFISFGAITCLLCLNSDALAMGESTPGRKVWDLVLLWINFGILVFIFLKFGKTPLVDFLRGEQRKIEDDLNAVNKRFETAKAGMDAEANSLDDIEQELEKMRKNILEMGRREKEKIIAQGKISAEKMIKDAEDYAKYQIAKAKKALSEEMVDIAVSMVEEKLIKGISEEDNEKLIKQFVVDLETYKPKI